MIGNILAFYSLTFILTLGLLVEAIVLVEILAQLACHNLLRSFVMVSL
jgi:hypothetical protein